MNMRSGRYYAVILPVLTGLFLFAVSCKSKKQSKEHVVVVHELSDPDMLNPLNYQGDMANLLNLIYQPLLGIDFKTLELIPVLAKSRPVLETKPDGRLWITYEIRPEAKWDNGKPITAADMEFSIKVIKNPKVDCHRVRPYYEFIDSMILYSDNPLKFTFVCKEKYILAESSSGDFTVLPDYIYDSLGLMKDFTVHQLNRNAAELANDPKIIKFAELFNSQKHQREKGYIVGSGAYEFTEWQTGQRIKLVRKQNWWGDQLKQENVYFEAFAEKVVYETINDMTTALVALKALKLDVVRGIPPNEFIALPKSKKIVDNFNLHTPTQLAYDYLGINMRLPKFSDKKVRQALAHLMDTEKFIKEVLYGLAQPVIGPFHPSKKLNYNDTIKAYPYDIDRARLLLEEAGWKDSNGNGTIDKEINGERQEFTVELTYNSGNERRKQEAIMFKEGARKVGIDVNVLSQEWSVFLENQKNHKFEMYCGGWIGAPVPEDPKQIWHTESYNGGSNYAGFGNADTDKLIEEIRSELDEQRRAHLYRRFQEILHEDVPYIFLLSLTERLAISKKFENVYPSVMRPGFWEGGFKLAAGR